MTFVPHLGLFSQIHPHYIRVPEEARFAPREISIFKDYVVALRSGDAIVFNRHNPTIVNTLNIERTKSYHMFVSSLRIGDQLLVYQDRYPDVMEYNLPLEKLDR